MAKINHNDTNLNGLQELMKKRSELMAKRDKDNKYEIIKDNLYNWQSNVPEYYRSVTFNMFSKVSLAPVAYYHRNLKIPFRLITHGSESEINNMYIYALLRDLITLGVITPNEIRITTVQEGASAVMGGFQKQQWRDDFFDKKAKVFVLLGCSRNVTDMNITGVEKFISMFEDFVNTNHKRAFFAYQDDFKEMSDFIKTNRWAPKMSLNMQTTAALLGNKVVQIPLQKSDIKKQ